jgi:hypothetical protein
MLRGLVNYTGGVPSLRKTAAFGRGSAENESRFAHRWTALRDCGNAMSSMRAGKCFGRGLLPKLRRGFRIR